MDLSVRCRPPADLDRRAGRAASPCCNGLEDLPDEVRIVVVHDAARPLVDERCVDARHRRSARGAGAVAALPVIDTLKEVDGDGRVVRTIPRDGLWRAQTPQAFPRDMHRAGVRAARERRARIATDCAALCERLGLPVVVVRGTERAIEGDRGSRLRSRGSAERGKGMTAVRVAIPFWSPAEIESAIAGHDRAFRANGVLGVSDGDGLRIRRRGRSRVGRCAGSPQGSTDRASRSSFSSRRATWSRVSTFTLPATPRDLAARHWPGPLTLVLPGGERRVPDRLRGPEGGVAVRWTSHRRHGAADPAPRRADHVDERQSPRGSPPAMAARRRSWRSGATRWRAVFSVFSTAGGSRPHRRPRW